jgi:hypothetical protein
VIESSIAHWKAWTRIHRVQAFFNIAGQNPNIEIRNPKQYRISNEEMKKTQTVSPFRIFFIRISDLFRISTFGCGPKPLRNRSSWPFLIQERGSAMVWDHDPTFEFRISSPKIVTQE